MEEIIYICVYLNNAQLALYQGGTDLNFPQTCKRMYAHTHTHTHTRRSGHKLHQLGDLPCAGNPVHADKDEGGEMIQLWSVGGVEKES